MGKGPLTTSDGTRGQCRSCQEWQPLRSFLRQRAPSRQTGKPRKPYWVMTCEGCAAAGFTPNPAAVSRRRSSTLADYYLPTAP